MSLFRKIELRALRMCMMTDLRPPAVVQSVMTGARQHDKYIMTVGHFAPLIMVIVESCCRVNSALADSHG